MSPRRRRSFRSSNTFVIFVLILVIIAIGIISEVIVYLLDNLWIVYALLMALSVLFITYVVVTIINIKNYKASPYYKDTNTPYRKLKQPGMRFESNIYNKLAENFPDATLLANALIPRANAVNEYFEIDILMFSRKGIFALELKDWAGFIYGDTESDNWTIGNAKDKHRQTISVYSPYKQNERHIEDLNNIHPHPYISHIIFSERAHIGQGIETVTNYEGFIERYQRLEDSLDSFELKEHYHTIAAKLDPSKLPDHIERIKYNQVRYR